MDDDYSDSITDSSDTIDSKQSKYLESLYSKTLNHSLMKVDKIERNNILKKFGMSGKALRSWWMSRAAKTRKEEKWKMLNDAAKDEAIVLRSSKSARSMRRTFDEIDGDYKLNRCHSQPMPSISKRFKTSTTRRNPTVRSPLLPFPANSASASITVRLPMQDSLKMISQESTHHQKDRVIFDPTLRFNSTKPESSPRDSVGGDEYDEDDTPMRDEETEEEGNSQSSSSQSAASKINSIENDTTVQVVINELYRLKCIEVNEIEDVAFFSAYRLSIGAWKRLLYSNEPELNVYYSHSRQCFVFWTAHLKRLYRISLPLTSIESIQFYHKLETKQARLLFTLLPSSNASYGSLFPSFSPEALIIAAQSSNAMTFETAENSTGQWEESEGDWTEGSQASLNSIWAVDINEAENGLRLLDQIGTTWIDGDHRPFMFSEKIFYYHNHIADISQSTTEQTWVSASTSTSDSSILRVKGLTNDILPLLSHPRSTSVDSTSSNYPMDYSSSPQFHHESPLDIFNESQLSSVKLDWNFTSLEPITLSHW